MPSIVICGVQIAPYSYLWCADCPLALSKVCGLPFTVIHCVWIALYGYLWCADRPIQLSKMCKLPYTVICGVQIALYVYPPVWIAFWAASPKETKSCRTQGTFVRSSVLCSFVCSFVCLSPPRPSQGLSIESRTLGWKFGQLRPIPLKDDLVL